MERRTRILTATIIGALLTASHAAARLPNPGDAVRDMRTMQAVHAPTGCVAKVFLIDGAVSRATIIDPACLPRGVAERDVPGSRRDFNFSTN